MKSAFIAIVGRPSTGKSTLINRMCARNVSITAEIPQTTRNTIRGIVNRKEGQLVFLDTPGYHNSERMFNLRMLNEIERTIRDCDAVLYLLDVTRPPGKEDEALITLVSKIQKPVFVALNKCDKDGFEREALRGILRVNLSPQMIVETSALKGKGVEELLQHLFDFAPEGVLHYPQDVYTDQLPEFRMSEIIRGEAISRLYEEIPHALYIEIVDTEVKNEGKKIWIRAFINVETSSQQGIVIGKEGKMIRSIKAASLKTLNLTFPYKIELDLQVRVSKKWRSKEPVLNKIFEN